MEFLSEKLFEDLVVEEFIKNNWKQIYYIDRIGQKEVINWKLLKESIIKINPLPNNKENNVKKAIFEIQKILDSALESNIKGFNFLKEGITVFDDIQKRPITLKIISTKDNSKNTFEFFRQMEISDGESIRIPDIVVFINGLPVSIIELKSPDANQRLESAYKQNESLKTFCSSLFTFNLFNVISNKIQTKYGSITSGFRKYFNASKWTEETNFIKQLFNKDFLIKIINEFSFFDNSNKIKYLAAIHQIKAIESTIKKLSSSKDNKGGVVWHTQGSGKSVTMLMLSRAILNKFPTSTILVITDRNSLDRQLYERFSQSSEYLSNTPKDVESRKDLIKKLNDKKYFGIYFTTIQKFSTQTGVLSNRDDIFILVDEAHRTQNNIEGEKIMSLETKEFIMKFGFARYMRDAFPNAKLTGFTGTPLMNFNKETINIFGNYNHIYSMNASIEDEFTVPIYYESRKLNTTLNEKYLKEIDLIQHEYAKTLNPDDIQSKQKMDSLIKSVNIKAILEDDNVIKTKTKDILSHLKERSKILHGKAMIIASTRKAAFKYYKEIIKQDASRKESTILVMTHDNKDNAEMESSIVSKKEIDNVATEFRKPNSKYKIAIVVDMWLTGFDVPDLDVMYIDKVIKWHNLMQAIARVNRTYYDKEVEKESGLIVDYLGIWKYLSDALLQYANGTEKIFDFSLEDIQKAEYNLKNYIDIINENYIPNIINFNNLDSKEQFKFVINSFEKVSKLKIEEKNKFIQLSRKIKKLFKITFTYSKKEISTIAKAIEIINSLLSTSNTLDDEVLNLTIENIKKAIKKAVDTSMSNVYIKTTKIKKDINEVASLLEEEAQQLRKETPLIAKKLLENSINASIESIKKTRPMFAKKVSEKLKDILSKTQKQEDLNTILDLMFELAKEITNEKNKKPEYKDPYLQAFFTILADDKYLKRNKSSEVLKKIAEDLMNEAKLKCKNGIQTAVTKSKLKISLMKVLKNQYNYPPEELGGISGILINEITRNIDLNPDYFVGKKEI